MQSLNPFVRFAARSRVYIHAPVCAYDCRLLYVLDGEGMISTGKHSFLLKPGALCYYPAGICYHIQGKNLEFFTLNFDFTSDFSELSTVLPPVRPHIFDKSKVLLSFEKTGETIFSEPFCIEDASSLLNELEAIVIEKESCLILNGDVTSAHLKLLLCKIVRFKSNTKPDETAFLKALEYIRKNYKNPIDNTVVAKAISYHPNYINSVVRQKTGISLHRYITAFRIGKATDLLCGTTLSVQEIATQCGFVNANHFSVCFKKMTGASPLNFRKGEK